MAYSSPGLDPGAGGYNSSTMHQRPILIREWFRHMSRVHRREGKTSDGGAAAEVGSTTAGGARGCRLGKARLQSPRAYRRNIPVTACQIR